MSSPLKKKPSETLNAISAPLRIVEDIVWQTSPSTDSRLAPVWTEDWETVRIFKSNKGDFVLGDDEWIIDPKHVSGTIIIKSGQRTVNFQKLRDLDVDDVEGLVRRVKRIAWIVLHALNQAVSTAVTSIKNLMHAVIMVQPKIAIKLNLPEDGCPDGWSNFSTISQKDFEECIPITQSVRNVVIITKK